MKLFKLFLLTGGILAVAAFSGQAGPIVWTNTTGGNWNAATNWSPNQVPGATDDAFITNSGTYTVTLNLASSVGTLTLGGSSGTQTLTNNSVTLTLNGSSSVGSNGLLGLGGGTLNGAGSLNVNGTFLWSGGTISSAGVITIGSGGNLTLNGTTKVLNGVILVNTATATWSAGTIETGNGSVVSNAPSGTFNITFAASTVSIGGNRTFANAGQINVNPGSGNTVSISDTFNNSAAVNIQSGTFSLGGGGTTTSTGSFAVSSGATLDFSGNTQTLSSGSSISGAGNFSVSGGTVAENGTDGITGTNIISGGALTFAPGSTAALTALTITSGTLGCSNVVSVSGPMTWSGGSITGTNTLTANGGLTMSGTTKILNGVILVNTATATWSAGTIETGNGSVVSNAPSGTFNITFAASTVSIGGNRTFANAGQINVNPGSGNTVSISDTFNNSAAVNIQSGTFSLGGGGTTTSTGSFAVSSGATLDFSGNTQTLSSGSSITGAGNFSVSGATAGLNGTFNIGGTNTFSGGTANFLGNYTISGNTVIVSAGTANFTTSGTIAPGILNISGGTLGCSNAMSVSGPMTWTGGVINGNNTVSANGGLTMGGTTKTLTGATLANAATATWSAGAINTGTGSVLSNAPSGIFNITFAATTGNAGGSRTFANAGQFNVNPGGGNTVSISDTFNNSAAVNVQSGTFSLQGGGTTTSTGSFAVSSGAILDFSGGTQTLSSGSSISGAGNFSVSGATAGLNGTFNIGGTNTFSGGTANFLGNYTINGNTVNVTSGTANFTTSGTIAPGILNISGGTLGCSNAVSVSGPMTWSGGSINGNNTVSANGGLTMGGTTKTLTGATLANAATATWSAGAINTGTGSVLSNAPSGIFNITFAATTGNAGGSRTFANAGQFNVNPGSGNTVSISDTFNNSAAVNVQSGTFSLSGGGTTTSTGSFAVPSGTTLDLSGGTQTLAGGSSITGAGNFSVSGATVNENGTDGITGTNIISSGALNFSSGSTAALTALTITGGTLGCSNVVSVSGPATWNGGTISGNNTVTANGGLTISGTTKTLTGATLANAATATWSAGQLNTGSGSVFSNAPSGTFNITFAASTGNAGGSRTFANTGQFNVNPGSGNTASISDSFNNSGTVTAQSGTLALSGVYDQTAGLTLLNGGNINNTSPLQIGGGTLGGTGAVTGSVTNNGAVSPGDSPGKLIIGGNYFQTTNGALNIELAGTVPGTSFDLLVVTNNASLAGTLNVTLTNGFYPATNALFTFLTAGTRSNTFANFNYPSNLIGLQVDYATNSASVQVINVHPVIAAIPDQNIPEVQPFTITATATDADQPAQTLSWSLISGPTNLTINPNTGVINWTPAQTQSPSTNPVTIAVTDNGNPPLSGTNSFNITVYEVNVAPVLPVIPPQAVNAQALLTVTNTAVEANIHATVGYQLTAPVGANISSNGIITWTPTRSQGPSTNVFTTVATNLDVFDLTNTSLSATNTFTVVVYAPTLAAISNFTVNPGQTVSFTASATDNDPTRILSFSITSGPGGIVSGSGLFTYRPPVAIAGTSTNVQITVSDNSLPPVTDSKSFSISVNTLAPVVLTAPTYTNGQFAMQISGMTGPDYIIVTSTNLQQWSDLSTNLQPTTPFQFTDPAAGGFSQRFYRVRLAP